MCTCADSRTCLLLFLLLCFVVVVVVVVSFGGGGAIPAMLLFLLLCHCNVSTVDPRISEPRSTEDPDYPKTR